MQVEWTKKALRDYKSVKSNKRIINKIHQLLESIEDKYDYGIGKPERLKWYQERLLYSRRIDEKNRIVYEVFLDSNKVYCVRIVILQIIGHY